MGNFTVRVRAPLALLVLCLNSGLAIFANAKPADLGVPPLGIMGLTAVMVMLGVVIMHMVPMSEPDQPPAVSTWPPVSPVIPTWPPVSPVIPHWADTTDWQGHAPVPAAKVSSAPPQPATTGEAGVQAST
jgi:hypothetical protein